MAKQNSVIIDPGHGGSDPGAVYGNRREKDDTLALSYDIGNALERRGVRVEYTRVGDVYNSPYEKAQIGNSSTADLFLSIHRNAMAVPGSASGTLSLIFGRGGDAETFAELEKQTAGEEMPGFYMVQTGIYRVRANAEREVEHLKSQGFPAFMTFKDGLYYVRAGAFRNMENAVRQEQELRKLGYPTLLVKT